MIEVVQFRHPGGVRLDIAHIANMPSVRIGSCVGLVRWIKMSAGRTRIGCAAIAKFMDMKPMFARSKATDFRVDLNPVRNFGERDRAANVVTLRWVEHGDCFQRGGRFFFRHLRPRRDRRE